MRGYILVGHCRDGRVLRLERKGKRNGCAEDMHEPSSFLGNQTCAIRHVAAGLSVATQRVFIGASHGWCRYQSLRCEDAAAQKGIFADSLTLGVLACLTLGEIAIRDSRSKVALDMRSKAD